MHYVYVYVKIYVLCIGASTLHFNWINFNNGKIVDNSINDIHDTFLRSVMLQT